MNELKLLIKRNLHKKIIIIIYQYLKIINEFLITIIKIYLMSD